MKKNSRFLIIYLSLILISCKKSDTDPIFPLSPSKSLIHCQQNRIYFPLTKGSYWIYENSNFVSTENTRYIYNHDSCYIINDDSLINGKLYVVMATTTFNYQQPPVTNYTLYRYNGDYVEANKEYNLFSYCKTGEVLYTAKETNNFWISEYKILDKDTSISVPAGSFETRITENKYLILNSTGTNVNTTLYNNSYYGKNVGLVYSKCPFLSTPENYLEKRLLRYQISGN